jgi:hypothetical protein
MKSQSNRAEFFSENRRMGNRGAYENGASPFDRTAQLADKSFRLWCTETTFQSSALLVRRVCVTARGAESRWNMENAVIVKRQADRSDLQSYEDHASAAAGIVVPFESRATVSEIPAQKRLSRQLVSTKELSSIWGVPESTLRYWRSAETGPPYVKLGGRIKYDLADVERYVRANKRMPSVRAHGG